MDAGREEAQSKATVIIPSAPIDKLPLLVMSKIFKLLSTHDRESAMMVCGLWYDIINYEVGRSLFIGHGLQYNFVGRKTIKMRPFEIISKVGVDKCLFGELVKSKGIDYKEDDDDDEDESADDHSGVEGFLLPELVRELSFYGKVSCSLFQVIMSEVYWLTTLKIHLSVFRHVSFEKYTLQRLSVLTRLQIFYTHPFYNIGFPFKEDDPSAKAFIHKSLSCFLKTGFFRSIQVFEFLSPYFIEKMANLVESVRTFVVRHQVSLKELILSFPYEWNVRDAGIEAGQRETSLDDLSSLASGLQFENKMIKHNWGDLQLNTLQIVAPATIVPPIYTTNPSRQPHSFWASQSFEIWQNLMKTQMNFEKIEYINKLEKWNWSLPQSIFEKNPSLKVVSLSVSSRFPVDCQALSCCENLQKLSLEGNYFHLEDPDQDDMLNHNNNTNVGNHLSEVMNGTSSSSSLFNVHLLPKQLKEICLSKLMIPVAEVEALVDGALEPKRFPNLQSLQLYQICKGYPQFGLTAAAVERLFDQSGLSVSFWQAVNRTSFQSAISKALNKVIDSDVITLMKVLEHCDTTEQRTSASFHFSTVYECHVQLIRKSNG